MTDKSVVPLATQTVLTCSITGLSQDTPISWLDPDNNVISNSDSSNYAISVSSAFSGGSKESTLTIYKNKLGTLSGSVGYTCKLKSAQYTSSPDVTKTATLTILEFGKYR